MVMTHATTGTLPKGMALVETFDGRWFPAFTPDTKKPYWVLSLEDAATTIIPPALDPLIDPYQGYDCREEAFGAYHAWHEAAVLPVHWQVLATHTEVYPERNAWYLDEITHLTGNYTPLLACGTDVYAAVIDEALEALYQRVYVRHYRQ